MQEQQEDLGDIVQTAVAAALADLSEVVKEEVKVVLEQGDFLLPGGASPQDLLDEHDFLRKGQGRLEENQGKMLDVLVGPVIEDWAGEPDPDGRCDEDEGMVSTVARLDFHMANGGVPVALPTTLKAAIYTSSAVIIGALLTGAAVVAAQIIGG